MDKHDRLMGEVNSYLPSRLYVRVLAGGIAVLSALLLATYVWLTFYGGRELQLDPAFSTAALVLLYMLGALFGIYIFRDKLFEARLRRSWLLITVAALVSALVEILWFAYSKLHIQAPLGLTEMLSLSYYPLVLVALLTYPFAPGARRERLIFWMDIVIVATTLGMFLWVFILNTLQTLLEVYPNGVFGVVFPAADLLLLAGFIALIQQDVARSARVSLAFLALGALCATVADGWSMYCQMSGEPCNLDIVGILRLGAAEATLVAAALQIILRSGMNSVPSASYKPFSLMLRLVIPYLAVVAGWGLLINMVYRVGYADSRVLGSLYGSIVLVVLVLVRQFIVLQENARLYRVMQMLAVTDSLTGLYNRHFFNEILGREIERSRRYSSALTLLLMDVDRFKMFNDRYGHLQGDEVLKRLAGVLSGQLRKADILARFGGDEFAVILPETDRGGAISVSRKIERSVAEQKYKDWPLGVCVGVGVYNTGMNLEDLVEQADRNLYRHKAVRSSAQIIRDAEQAAGISQAEPENQISSSQPANVEAPRPQSGGRAGG
jgi:diguanylate cyclase (GGDEF)-like protein